MEELNFMIVLIIFFDLIFACFCAVVANAKKQNGLAWFFAGLFFSIIALIAIAGMPVQIQKLEDKKK